MSLTTEVRDVKARRGEPCPVCRGSGRHYDHKNDTDTCGGCDGLGTVILVPADPPAPPKALYVATSADVVLAEASCDLTRFAKQLQKDWPELNDEHVAIWRVGEGEGPRLVAMLLPAEGGLTAIRWL